MIDFTRAFDSAWERMNIILFRPFDFGKWCAIGLGAFLAGFLQGGNGLNGAPNSNSFNPSSFNPSQANANLPKVDIQQFNSNLSHSLAGMQVGLIVLISVIFIVVIFAFLILMYWLGARGQFMFLDNVVRNRGAVAWPWTHYARQANGLFFFFLLLFLVAIAVMLVLVGGAAVMGIPLLIHKEWPSGVQMTLLAILGILYFLFCIGFYFITFIFRELGIPLMFRNGLTARAAFVESMSLVARFPGSIAVFVILRIAIFIAVIILALILCCLTIPLCCMGQWPYIGTVFLLPVLVYVKCFTLDCLAQFGPECDVWTVDVPPVNLSEVSPPPPPV
jgi:hypothetical protein